jgi:hypothetical protein
LQGAHPAHRRAVPDDRVRLVHLVEIEVLQPEALRARNSTLLDDRRERQDGEDLGRDERHVALSLERTTENALTASEPVDLGGVEERDPELQRTLDDAHSLNPCIAVAVAPLARPELPRTKADLRDRLREIERQVPHRSKR